MEVEQISIERAKKYLAEAGYEFPDIQTDDASGSLIQRACKRLFMRGKSQDNQA